MPEEAPTLRHGKTKEPPSPFCFRLAVFKLGSTRSERRGGSWKRGFLVPLILSSKVSVCCSTISPLYNSLLWLHDQTFPWLACRAIKSPLEVLACFLFLSFFCCMVMSMSTKIDASSTLPPFYYCSSLRQQ